MGEYLFVGSAMLSIANGIVLLWVNPRRSANQTFFLSCMCISLWCLCLAMAIREGKQSPIQLAPLHFWLRASSGVGAFLCWLIWLMKAALLEQDSTFKVILRKSWPWFSLSCAIAAIAFSESYMPSSATPENREHGLGYSVYSLSIVVCCTFFLIDALRRDAQLTGIRKIELRYFVVNAIIACLLVVSSHVISLYIDLGWLRRSSSVLFPLLNCAAVWAICYHRVFDAKHIVFSIGQRVLLLGTLGVLSIAIYESLDDVLGPRWSMIVATVAIAALVVVGDRPMRRAMGLDPARILLAPRKVLIDLAREFSSEEALRLKFSELLKNWCQTNIAVLLATDGDFLKDTQCSLPKYWSGFIYLSKNGWATPETLQRSKSAAGSIEVMEFMLRNDFGALFAAPKGSNPPSLVVCLGQKESLRPYTFPDIDVLLGLVELMDNILTHSRATASAARIEKLASAAMISRGLAHDLNNLATPVSTFLLCMEDQVKAGSQEAVVLADAKHSLKVMQDYIGESLFFGRQLTPNLINVNSRELLHSVARLTNDRARTMGVSVAVRAGDDFQFYADFALMQRSLQNLIFNGIDASSAGETVQIAANQIAPDQVQLTVSDLGTGITPEIRSKIFEPYFTTKDTGNMRRGLGLGLAICKKIAELHGGSISVIDNDPRGTVFRILLPLKRPAESPTPTRTEGVDTTLSRRKFDQKAALV